MWPPDNPCVWSSNISANWKKINHLCCYLFTVLNSGLAASDWQGMNALDVTDKCRLNHLYFRMRCNCLNDKIILLNNTHFSDYENWYVFRFLNEIPCVKINVGLITLVAFHFVSRKADAVLKNTLCRWQKLRQQQRYFEKHDIALTVVTHYIYKHNNNY